MVRKALLLCGILSSILYVATDVLGGMRYEGYSFTSQAISELMATGAPSEAFVDPLFLTYGVLALAFGVGVFREGVGRSRSLRTTGALLMGYAALGLAGPTLFEMNRRGAASLQSDAPHIILTGGLVLLTLLAIDMKRGLQPKDALLVDISALYWHFVDVVWIAIFTLVYLIR